MILLCDRLTVFSDLKFTNESGKKVKLFEETLRVSNFLSSDNSSGNDTKRRGERGRER